MVPFILTVAALYSESGAPPRAVELCARVMQLQPKAHPAWACSFAGYLHYWSEKYGTDATVSVAIAMQESSLLSGRVSRTGDVGVFQFSPGTVKQFRIDRKRLGKDVSYEIQMHLLVLKAKLEMCPGKNGWSCYHSVTPRFRLAYQKLVGRYLPHATH